jgi:hypothetical protein
MAISEIAAHSLKGLNNSSLENIFIYPTGITPLLFFGQILRQRLWLIKAECVAHLTALKNKRRRTYGAVAK